MERTRRRPVPKIIGENNLPARGPWRVAAYTHQKEVNSIQEIRY